MSLKSRIIDHTCSTGASITSLTYTVFAMLFSQSEMDLFEVLGLPGYGLFGWQPLHRACPVESMTVPCPAQYPSRVRRLGNLTTVAQHDHIGSHGKCRLRDGIDAGDTFVERESGFRTDRAIRCETHMRDDHISARAGHSFRLLWIKDIRSGKEILLVGEPDHFHFLGVTHPGFFQVLAEDA